MLPTNLGYVKYKSVEVSPNVMPIQGLKRLGNASDDHASTGTTGAQAAKAPFSTAVGGFIYCHGGLHPLLSQKYTGPQYATEYSTTSGGAMIAFALGNGRPCRLRRTATANSRSARMSTSGSD
jgi:iron complex outermembrane receptor protein